MSIKTKAKQRVARWVKVAFPELAAKTLWIPKGKVGEGLQNTSQRRLHERPRQSHVLQSVALEVVSGTVPLGHFANGILDQCPCIS